MSYSQADQAGKRAQDAQALEDAKNTQVNAPGGPSFGQASATNAAAAQKSMSQGATAFENPGSADYGGGPGMADFYAAQARHGRHENDAEVNSNTSALDNSIANMKGNRGPQSVENSALLGREAATRNGQIDALGMARSAALGGAPSTAAFQTKFGMNNILGGYAGNAGGARGLSALGGAQTGGAAMAGGMAGDLAAQGGMSRSKEIADAIGGYGGLAGQVRGQDLTRLGSSDQNNLFNAQANDSWKLGNANLAASQANLGNAQENTNLGWMNAEMAPEDKQFQYDQEMAAEEAGADADKAGGEIAASRESRDNTRNNVNAGITAGLGAVGSMAGPAGTAAGLGLGGTIASATKRYY